MKAFFYDIQKLQAYIVRILQHNNTFVIKWLKQGVNT